jgi:adenylate cyclase
MPAGNPPPRRRGLSRSQVFAVICTGAALLVLALHHFGFRPLLRLERATEDLRTTMGRQAPLHPDLVFLAIDRPDYTEFLKPEELTANPVLAQMNGWPWNRAVHAAILERLMEAGAKVVCFDVVFAASTPEDELFRAALEKHRERVVLGALILEQDVQGQVVEQIALPEAVIGEGALDELKAATPMGRIGYVNFSADEDDVVRRAQYTRHVSGIKAASLALRVLERSRHSFTIPAVDGGPRLRFAGEPGRNYEPIPIYQLFLPKTWSGRFSDGAFFRDKIVFIGPYGEWARDRLPTPFGQMPGPEVHLAAIGAALQNEFFAELRFGWTTILVIIAAVGAWYATSRHWRPTIRFGALCALGGGFLAVALGAHLGAGQLLPITPPLFVGFLGGVPCLVYDFLLSYHERRRIRQMFATMVSPDVLGYMQEHPERFRLAGERRQATMFFSDLAGFTTISEGLSPDDLAMVLNRYLTPMSDILLRHGGYIDKYEGDAIMADFGVPVWKDADPASHAWRACWAALEQMEALRALQPQFKADYGVDIDMRIGINTGTVSAGNMGSEQKFQYTVMGDAVNQAARFEPANKLFGTHILIGEETFQLAQDRIEARFIAALVVKGKTQPVNCYELLAKKGDLPETQRRIVELFEEGWRLHAERKFSEAMVKFDGALALDAGDGPSLTYRRLCETLVKEPPPVDWAGEFVQTSK